jgi:beta-N-acetylhexosaminidase
MAALERLARACILPGFAGETAPGWLLRELDAGLAGVVLFGRNVRDPEQLRALTASIRVSPETVVAIDEEGGDVTRLETARGSSVPGALALGEIDDPALTEAVAGTMADALREVGVTHDLAPVADVNTSSRNPVIGVRSFGSNPQLVARHVAASVTGLQAGGIAACVKHFPGHGGTEVDSHHGLPTIDATRDELTRVELVPFVAAFEAGALSLMTAHIVVPALDALPATLSRTILTGLLREELGFEGMVVTDALEMGAIAGTYGMGEAAVGALAAGADALCLGHDIDESHVALVRDAIVAAVREGRLTEDRLAEATGRVAASHAPPPAVNRAGSLGEVGLAAARRALQVAGDPGAAGPVLVLELEGTLSVAAGPPAHDLADVLRGLGADADTLHLGPSDLTGVVAAVQARPGRRPVVVVRDVDRHPWQRTAAAAVAAADPGAVVVDVGYPSGEPLCAPRVVTTFGAGRASLTAAAELLMRESQP